MMDSVLLEATNSKINTPKLSDLRQEVGREILEVRSVHPFPVVLHDQEAPALAAKLHLYFDLART